MEPREAIALCADGHRRLLARLEGGDDSTARRPSRLPGWSVGHVLTHLARNADGHIRRLEGALAGREVARYPGGPEQREQEIQTGASRPWAELAGDVRDTARRLEETWARCEVAGWPHAELVAADRWPTTGSPVRRLREVEVHHVDLGLGYEPEDWPEAYVRWELEASLPRLPERIGDLGDTRGLVGWLTGRGAWPREPRLSPWL